VLVLFENGRASCKIHQPRGVFAIKEFDLIDDALEHIDVLPHAPTGTDPPDPESGLLERWLLDPSTVYRDFLAHLRTNFEHFWATARPLIVVGFAIVVAVVVLLWWLRGRAWRRARTFARWVEVVPPAATGTEDGQAIWPTKRTGWPTGSTKRG